MSLSQTQSENIRVNLSCYQDQFRKQLKILEPRLLKYCTPLNMTLYYLSGISETEAVYKFIDSHEQLI